MPDFSDANQALEAILRQFQPYQIQQALAKRVGLDRVKEMVEDLEYFNK
jgi:hypothetical protein